MDKSRLNEALQVVKMFAQKRAYLPILSHVYVHQSNGTLWFRATDLESQVTFQVYDHPYADDWRACIPVHMLADLIKEQGGDPLLRPGENYSLVIETANGERTIAGHDPDDFPVINRETNEEYVIIPVDTFLAFEPLPKTADTSGKRYGLDNVNFRCTHYGEGKAETTDGYRLATVPCAWLPEPWNFMIPARQLKKAIAAVKKIRKQLDDVELFRSEKGLTIIAGPMEIWLSFAEGTFPDTSKLEPNGFTSEFKTKDFMQAIKQVKVMTDKRDAGVTMNFTGVGSAYTFVCGEVGYMVGQTKTFNAGYVLDAIRKCNGTVRITSNEQVGGPWKFGEEIVMPMRGNLDRPAIAPSLEPIVTDEPRKIIPLRGWAAVTRREQIEDHGSYFNPAA